MASFTTTSRVECFNWAKPLAYIKINIQTYVSQMKKSLGEKILIWVGVIGGAFSLAGTWVYLPTQVKELREIQKADHDVLVEMKADVKNITSRLDRNNVNGSWLEQRYYEKYLASTNGLWNFSAKDH